ncbi:hypothetical protein PoB_007234200 [Plakobranchus ocellatus]|uniref:Uncharacterized protein n=1 Tax=Plakobranchus ocellatus TaxID=259542 RepID=A0AAV4DNH2_9GAST|nr:hypothetical protein PoB_007234200 [Plakobranchus ocellatus]
MFRPACRLSARSRRIPSRGPGVRIHLSVLSAVLLILSPCSVTGDNGWDWLFGHTLRGTSAIFFSNTSLIRLYEA